MYDKQHFLIFLLKCVNTENQKKHNKCGENDVFTTSDCFLLVFAVKYEKIKFLVIALKDSIEIYAWAPKPYHKFMAFKVSSCRYVRLMLICLGMI